MLNRFSKKIGIIFNLNCTDIQCFCHLCHFSSKNTNSAFCVIEKMPNSVRSNSELKYQERIWIIQRNSDIHRGDGKNATVMCDQSPISNVAKA